MEKGDTVSARILAIPIAAAVFSACGTESGPSAAGPDVVVDTIGDTIVVRTLAGSVWGSEATLVPEQSIGELDGAEEYLFGNIAGIDVDDGRRVHVLDSQSQNVRVFDAEGLHLRTVGRRGEGPGELETAGSVALLPDGRILVQEVLGMVVQVYDPDGRYLEQWTYHADGITLPPKPMTVDKDGQVHVVATRSSSSQFLFEQVVVLGLDGALLTTLDPPGSDFEPPSVEVRFMEPIGGHETAPHPVPLTPRHHWALHPNGHFVTGISSDYRIDVGHEDGVLRIERAFEPVPVSEAERTYHREDVSRGMRVSQPDWEWNGPGIPRTRPPFRGLGTGRDGRIWVTVSTEAHPVENERHDPRNPNSDPMTWQSPLRYDVFEPDGTWLGTVVPPEGFARSPRPVFDGDHVWAVSRDELGVERVVRYRIVVDGGSPAGGDR